MKKVFTIVGIVFLISFSSCRVTKSVTMMGAKINSKLTEEEFINKKLYEIRFLELTQKQKDLSTEIWKKEIAGLKMPVLKNENIAPIIYNSEIEFRNLLTNEQKEKYKVIDHDLFLNDRQIEELKRIYSL